MLEGKDPRLWPLDDRREQLREIIQHLPATIRYSEISCAAFRADEGREKAQGGVLSLNAPAANTAPGNAPPTG